VDDLAIAPFAAVSPEGGQYTFVPDNCYVEEAEFRELGLTASYQAMSHYGLRSDVFMVGRFSEYDRDSERIRSVMRFGHISMLPGEIPMSDGPQYGFLVEMRSVCGFSGSPVFVFDRQNTSSASLGPEWRSQLPRMPKLLGVEVGNVEPPVRSFSGNSSVQRIVDDWQLRANAGLTVVIPAWRLSEFVKTDPQCGKKIADMIAAERKRRTRSLIK
jgi:hypothetical protein